MFFCPKMHASPAYVIRYGEHPLCDDCPAGKYFQALGAAAEKDCGGCPLGTWSDISGASSLDMCKGCPAGKKGKLSGQGTVAAGCASCVAGESYQDQTGQASCRPAVCPKSKYASSSSSDADVTKTPACSDCPAGTYGGVQGLKTVEDCNACSAGKYSVAVGAALPATCELCPPGRCVTD